MGGSQSSFFKDGKLPVKVASGQPFGAIDKKISSAPTVVDASPIESTNPFDEPEDTCTTTASQIWDLLQVILIKQHVDSKTGLQTKYKYDLVPSDSSVAIVHATEKSGKCSRCCLGNSRGFHMSVVDDDDQVIFTFKRKFKYGAVLVPCNFLSCMACCNDEIVVNGRNGEMYGYIRGGWACFRSRYVILDRDSNPKYTVTGPCCVCSFQCMGQVCACTSKCCCKRGNFKICSLKGSQVGTIFKKYSSTSRDTLTLTDMAGVEFPVNCDIQLKTVLISAVFLIDMKHFEKYD